MAGASPTAGGGQSAQGGNAGPATSGGTSTFNISSGGGKAFNPFASKSNISTPHMIAMGAGVALIGFLLLKKK